MGVQEDGNNEKWVHLANNGGDNAIFQLPANHGV